MAVPSFCTSFGPRYLNTSAASFSPRERSRMALLLSPSSLIAGHPALDYIGDQLRVLARQFPRGLHSLTFIVHGYGGRVVLLMLGLSFRCRLGLSQFGCLNFDVFH